MAKAKLEVTEEPNESGPRPTCGIVMPISEIDGCGEGHWLELRHIFSDAIREAGFEPQMVSDSDDVGVIQKRIIQNLYENPIVVCDVSCKNPNVMFELGIRLAFDKPTIILKDDMTNYSFDTSPIEHLVYPRDLRFSKIVEFKEKLQFKIKQTHEIASKDPNFSTFLKHFGKFTVAKIDTQEVSTNEYILEELKALRGLFAGANRSAKAYPVSASDESIHKYEFELITDGEDALNKALLRIGNNFPTATYSSSFLNKNHYLITLISNKKISSLFIIAFLRGVEGVEEIIWR